MSSRRNNQHKYAGNIFVFSYEQVAQVAQVAQVEQVAQVAHVAQMASLMIATCCIHKFNPLNAELIPSAICWHY
jgi:hypothetical protein